MNSGGKNMKMKTCFNDVRTSAQLNLQERTTCKAESQVFDSQVLFMKDSNAVVGILEFLVPDVPVEKIIKTLKVNTRYHVFAMEQKVIIVDTCPIDMIHSVNRMKFHLNKLIEIAFAKDL